MPAMYNNMNNNDISSAVVSSLTTKIDEGSEITEDDLRAAEELLKKGDGSVPALDRSFLERWNSNQPQLVRYFGMVQDMLEPEYYISTFDGKSTHFRDVPVTSETPQEFVASNLAERIPLMVVPVPFASDWFLEATAPSVDHSSNNITASTTTTKIPASPEALMETTNRKRHRGDGDDDMDAGSTKPRRTEDAMDCATTTSCSEEQEPQGQELDWWPAGCMGSATFQCPALCKFYYDHQSSSSERRLRLNDLVEVVGILSVDPWEADFQHPDEAFGVTPPPPPSRLPRIHVLSYKVADLDKLTKSRMIDQEAMDHDEQPSITMTSPRSSCSPLKDIATSVFKDPVVAEALCMTLLSKAERETQNEEQMQRAPEHAIGCLSLQISTSHHASKQVFQQLSTVLRDVCPILATIDLSKKQQAPLLPSKQNGRLGASPLQLPRGSTVLIHVGGTARSSNQNNNELLQELVSQHRIPYAFEGGMRVPFDADFRMIVVTSSNTHVPCTLEVKLSQDLESIASRGNVLSQLRSSLVASQHHDNVGFSKTVLERAQQDFLAKRAQARKQQTAVPQEGDFHRWLTLTRLQARSQRRTSADISDWDRALVFDEAAQQTKQ